jgi:uncharacterized protein
VRIFIDANVMFAAAIAPDGACATLLRLSSLLEHELVSSPYALEEATRNVRLKRPAAEERLIEAATLVAHVPEAPKHLVIAAAHVVGPKDAPILASAVFAEADVLATGDHQHFGGIMGRSWGGVEVLSPRGILERVAAP